MNDTEFQEITYRNDLHNYLINRNGEIYSKRKHCVLKGTTSGYGYLTYTLYTDKGKAVRVFAHIAVAQQYIPNDDPEHKTIVNHIDENKRNPSVDNLEWTTQKENVNHGTCIKRSANHRKKPVNEYDLDGRYIRTWVSTRDMIQFYADFLGKTVKELQSAEVSINSCLRGNSKSSMNRIWRYYDGNTDNIPVPQVKGCMPIGITCSRSKMRLDFPVDVPDEYLYHPLSSKDIYDYFMSLDKLTDYEKQMFESYQDNVMIRVIRKDKIDFGVKP